MEKSPIIYVLSVISLLFCSIPLVKGIYSIGLFSENLLILSMGVLILPVLIALIFFSRSKLIRTL